MNALPASPAANAMYVIKDSSSCKIYITNTAGTPLPLQPGTAAGLDLVLQAGNVTTRSMQVGGVEVRTSASDTAYINEDGMFSNLSEMEFFSATSGITSNASVVGLLTTRNSSLDGISAAVVGIDQTSFGSSESYGGYFNSVHSGELYVPTKRGGAAEKYVIGGTGDLLLVYNYTGGGTGKQVRLPPPGKAGRTAIVKAASDQVDVITHTTGVYMVDNAGSVTTTTNLSKGHMAIFIWDGAYWQMGNMF